MQLHSDGKNDYIEELKKQKTIELKEVSDSTNSKKEKLTLYKRIVDKFNKLFKGADQSLYISDSLN